MTIQGKIKFLGFAALLDLIFTSLWYSNGIGEANIIMAAVLENFGIGGFAFLKTVITVTCLWVFLYSYNNHKHKREKFYLDGSLNLALFAYVIVLFPIHTYCVVCYLSL